MSLSKPAAGPLPVSPRILLCLRALLALLSATLVLLFLITALKRLHYPSEYDWIEDGMLASVRHVAAGLPLYQAPTVYFTPYLYTPVYLYVAAALAKVVGLGYPALRLVSIVSTLGCFGVIYGLVFSEVRRHLAAFAAAGLFAACYAATGNAFDIGRVDMLYLFFVLCAFYSTRRLNPIVAAIFWILAFQSKQGVLPIALLALCYDWQHPRRVLLGRLDFLAEPCFAGLVQVLRLWHGRRVRLQHAALRSLPAFGCSLGVRHCCAHHLRSHHRYTHGDA
jgi:hypothetical protein